MIYRGNEIQCATDIDVPGGVKPNEENETSTDLPYTYIAVGGGGGVLLAACVGIVVVVAVLVRKRQSRGGMCTECRAIPLVTCSLLFPLV